MNGFKVIIKPDEDDVEAAEVFVMGMVEQRPYQFLLDTGAARSSIAFDAYTTTFETVGTSNWSGTFAQSSADMIILPSITVGPITKQNLSVVRLAEGSTDTKSLVGMDFLKDFAYHFLFEHNRVEVNPADITEADYTVQELVFDKGFHPYIEVGFGPATANAVWDTGAGLTVVDLNFVNQQPAFFKEAGESFGIDSTGTKVATPMFMMDATTIGQTLFPPHKVAGVDLGQVNATIEKPMDLILGYTTLGQANWWFDFPRRRWAVTKLLNGD